MLRKAQKTLAWRYLREMMGSSRVCLHRDHAHRSRRATKPSFNHLSAKQIDEIPFQYSPELARPQTNEEERNQEKGSFRFKFYNLLAH